MKKYPKKYYPRRDHCYSELHSSQDFLSTVYVDTNTLSIHDVVAILTQQVVSSYRPNTIVRVFCLSYNTLKSLFSYNNIKSIDTIVASYHLAQGYLRALHLTGDNVVCFSPYSLHFRSFIKDVSSRLVHGGLLSFSPIPYFWDFQIAMSVDDDLVSLVPRPTTIHRLRYFIDSKKESVVVYVDAIENLFGQVALAVNPEDKRYKKLIGKRVIVPIINRIIPIVGDESVDISKYNGIVPIVPCHDRDSFFIAQRHHLPLDIYAYDQHGIFSKHATIYAGKQNFDFTENIIQYLQDIHNYDGREKCVLHVPFCAITNRYLGFFLADNWVIQTDTIMQRVIEFVRSDRYVYEGNKDVFIDMLQQRDRIFIGSSHGSSCINLTSSMQTSFTDVITYYHKNKKSQHLVLAMIIYDLMYDAILPLSFSAEQCIDVLFAQGFDGRFVWEEYCDYIVQHFSNEDSVIKDLSIFKSLLSTITVHTDSMTSFLDMLDTCSFLHQTNRSYHVIEPFVFHHGSFLNRQFLEACIPLFSFVQGYRTGKGLSDYNHANLSVDQLLISFLIRDTMQGGLYDMHTYILEDTYKFDSHELKRHCIQALDYYSSDTMRLALLQEKIDDIPSQELIIQKIWNVCRYVYMHIAPLGYVDLHEASLIELISHDTQQLTPFDQWIVYRFADVLSKLEDSHDDLFSVQHRTSLICQCIIDDFAIKYIAVAKQRIGPMTPYVMLLCVGQICSILAPIFPALVAEIRLFFADIIGLQSVDMRIINLPSKNYKIHLLMMIIGGLKNLKNTLLLRNHQSVDVCIQASPDIISFIQDHRMLIDSIVRIAALDFYGPEHNIGPDYIQEYVVDIVLGVKATTEVLSEHDKLILLLKDKTDYLDHLRALVSTGSYPDKVLKIDQLKQDIQDITYQLTKVKKLKHS